MSLSVTQYQNLNNTDCTKRHFASYKNQSMSVIFKPIWKETAVEMLKMNLLTTKMIYLKSM